VAPPTARRIADTAVGATAVNMVVGQVLHIGIMPLVRPDWWRDRFGGRPLLIWTRLLSLGWAQPFVYAALTGSPWLYTIIQLWSVRRPFSRLGPPRTCPRGPKVSRSTVELRGHGEPGGVMPSRLRSAYECCCKSLCGSYVSALGPVLFLGRPACARRSGTASLAASRPPPPARYGMHPIGTLEKRLLNMIANLV
jgi:hypothetical protein